MTVVDVLVSASNLLRPAKQRVRNVALGIANLLETVPGCVVVMDVLVSTSDLLILEIAYAAVSRLAVVNVVLASVVSVRNPPRPEIVSAMASWQAAADVLVCNAALEIASLNEVTLILVVVEDVQVSVASVNKVTLILMVMEDVQVSVASLIEVTLVLIAVGYVQVSGSNQTRLVIATDVQRLLDRIAVQIVSSVEVVMIAGHPGLTYSCEEPL
jgi:hypothetical protein